MSTTIQVRVDDELKINADNLFRDLGTDTTTAIRIFLMQAIKNNGFPFEIRRTVANPYIALSEEGFLEKLKVSRTHVEQGMHENADNIISDMRTKYDL